MATTTETKSSTRITPTRLASYGLAAAVLASLFNAIVRAAAVDVFGVPAGFQPLGYGPVLTTTVVGIVGATIAYGIIVRVSDRPNRPFLIVAGLALLLSFGPVVAPPSFLATAPASVLGTLAVMHVTTAVVAVGTLLRLNRGGGSP